MDLLTALQTKDAVGENGMPTHSTSGSSLVDLFFKQGAFRSNPDKTELLQLYQGAYAENKNLAIRCMFYNRDIRGGQGERESFRWMLRFMGLYYPQDCLKILPYVPFYGRWDDLFVLIGTSIESDMADFILSELKKGNQLCGKWMPRENKSKGWIAKRLMKLWELDPKNYRRLLSGNTQVVENLMCKNQWSEIVYEHVPGRASLIYKRAFGKHDTERYVAYLNSLEKGEIKAKSGTLFPNDIVHEFLNKRLEENEIKLLEAQWRDLPNYVPENLSFLPISDVSGSMSGQPMEVCIALSIYLSQRNKSVFKDAFVTFSMHPTLQILKGDSLSGRIRQLHGAHWEMNTDLEKVFELILSQALKNKVSEEDMPKVLIILSDMQFDQCTRYPNKTAMSMIKKMYRDAGYALPNIVFWNLRDSIGVPVKFDKEGTALVSGFSPSIMKQILNGGMNPMGIVLAVLNSERYSKINL